MVDAEVVRDPIHPGVESGITLEAIEVLVGFREGLLHDVQRVLATLLDDGRVLVSGGFGDLAPLASAEIYDPRTGTFSPVP